MTKFADEGQAEVEKQNQFREIHGLRQRQHLRGRWFHGYGCC